MATITVDVSQAVKKLDPGDMRKALKEALDNSVQLLEGDIKPYPPVPPGSSYVRTGALGRSWKRKVDPSRLYGEVGSEGVDYAVYVQGYPGQAWMHKSRWKTTQDVAEARAKDIARLFEQAIAKWAR